MPDIDTENSGEFDDFIEASNNGPEEGVEVPPQDPDWTPGGNQ